MLNVLPVSPGRIPGPGQTADPGHAADCHVDAEANWPRVSAAGRPRDERPYRRQQAPDEDRPAAKEHRELGRYCYARRLRHHQYQYGQIPYELMKCCNQPFAGSRFPVILAGNGEPAVPVAFIGAEGHGAVCIDPARAATGGDPGSWPFRVARLARPVPPPLQRMALGGEPLEVPPAEEPRFRDRYYPRLRRAAAVISSDGSFTPPAICGPDLVLHARYGGGHELEVSWEWAYRVGDSPLEAGGPDDVYRDLAAERTLLAGLDLPLDSYGLLTRDDGVPGAPVPALAPRTRLTGLDTMRFTTELLPLLAGQPGLIIEVDGEPADYREAGDSLRIAVSTDEVAGETDWFDLGVTITVEGRPVPSTT